MNKNLKNKIAALFAVLSVCSPQSSRAANATNNKIVKYLAIIVPSFLGGAGLIWGGVELAKYLKNKNNDQENKNPDGGIKFLEGKEKQDAEKLMDNFINQEWIFDKETKCFCKCINRDDVKNFKPSTGYVDGNIVGYRNYLSGKSIEINDETIDDINNKAGYHIQKMIEFYNEYKNMGSFYISKSMNNRCEILQFDVTDHIRIRVEYDKNSKKPLSLELVFLNKNVNDNINCHFYFKHKDIVNN